jgi:AcrR family transcriptional regulator
MSGSKDGRAGESGIGRRRNAAKKEGQKDYRSKRAAIIRVAAEVFKDKGFEAATLSDVAERFGIDRASLYYYVDSKAELFREGVQGLTDANVVRAEDILRLEEPARQRLTLLAEHLLESYDKSYPYAHVYLQEDMRKIEAADEEWSSHMARQIRRLHSIVMQMVTEGVEEGSFRGDVRSDVATNAFFGMINWTHRWYRPGRGLSPRELADSFCALFLEGLVARP